MDTIRNTSPVPVALDDIDTKAEFFEHRHLSMPGFHVRSQCSARCRCGHICAWHYDKNGFVVDCGNIPCDCNQFSIGEV